MRAKRNNRCSDIDLEVEIINIIEAFQCDDVTQVARGELVVGQRYNYVTILKAAGFQWAITLLVVVGFS